MVCLFPLALFADSVELPKASKCWTIPVVLTADEEVTFYYDLADVGFQESVDLYLWAWQPTEPDAGYGGNSSGFVELEYVGNNIYKKIMVPTQYFNSDALKSEGDARLNFWQRLKMKDGSIWSGVLAAPDSRSGFKEFKKSGDGIRFFGGRKDRGFTDKFTLDEPLAVVFDPSVYRSGEKILTELARNADFIESATHSGLNDWTAQRILDVWCLAVSAKTGLKKLSNGLYVWNVGIPNEHYAYNLQDTGQIDKPAALAGPDEKAAFQSGNMTYLIIEIIKGAAEANQWGVNNVNQEQRAGTATPYPDPVSSCFPAHLSSKDILTLTREYDECAADDLKYTIVAGTRTVTGTMPGVRNKHGTILDLNKELQGMGASELKVTVKDQHDKTVVTLIIPLVVAD